MGEIMLEEMELPIAERVARTGGVNSMSDAERQRRSVQAKRLVREGKLGPTKGRGGRPSKLKSKLAVQLSNQISSMSEAELIVAMQYLTAVLRIVREASPERPVTNGKRVPE
jgi:hypothetical protein